MKMVKGGAYVLNEGSYSDSGKLLPGGYAVILKEYDPLAERALIEFDGSKFWIDPSYLDFIEGDAPVESNDEPSKPAHYDTGIDTIAFMRANCPPEQVEGFLRGNVFKYLQRYDKKNGVDDLRKAAHYVQVLIEEVEGR
jgi:hypothetical protein